MNIAIFREEGKLAIAGFCAGPVTRQDMENIGGRENGVPREQHMASNRNKTRVTLVRGQ